MDAGAVKAFNTELASLYEMKPPVSKNKIQQITKQAIKAIKYYKHVVLSVEKFIQKCKPEYKVPGLYVIDSIVRQSRHQFGSDKDVFGPRFCKNLEQTFHYLLKCPDSDHARVLKVMMLWKKNGVLPAESVDLVLSLAKNSGVDVEGDVGDVTMKPKPLRESKVAENVEKSTVEATTPPRDESYLLEKKLDDFQKNLVKSGSNSDEKSSLDPTLLVEIQKLTNQLLQPQQQVQQHHHGHGQPVNVKLNKLLAADYEYSDDSGDEAEVSKSLKSNPVGRKIADAAQSLLQNTQLMQEIQKLQQSLQHQGEDNKMRIEHSMIPPPSLPSMGQPQMGQMQQHRQDMDVFPRMPTFPQFPHNAAMTPMNFGIPPPGMYQQQQQQHLQQMPQQQEQQQLPPFSHSSVANAHDAYSCPPPEPIPPSAKKQVTEDQDERKAHKHRSKRKRSGSRSRSRSRDKRHKRRERSRSGSAGHSHKHRKRSSSRDRRERDRERKRQGLPSVRHKEVSICSRTLWLGRMPQYCEDHEVRTPLRAYGEPVSIDIIPPRGCAYVVMPTRKSAFRVLDHLADMKIQNRAIKMAWAPGKGVKEQFREFWDADSGTTFVPWDMLPSSLDNLLDGGMLDVDSLPQDLKEKYANFQPKDTIEPSEAAKVGISSTTNNSISTSTPSSAPGTPAFPPSFAGAGFVGLPPFPPPMGMLPPHLMMGMPPPLPGQPMGLPMRLPVVPVTSTNLAPIPLVGSNAGDIDMRAVANISLPPVASTNAYFATTPQALPVSLEQHQQQIPQNRFESAQPIIHEYGQPGQVPAPWNEGHHTMGDFRGRGRGVAFGGGNDRGRGGNFPGERGGFRGRFNRGGFNGERGRGRGFGERGGGFRGRGDGRDRGRGGFSRDFGGGRDHQGDDQQRSDEQTGGFDRSDDGSRRRNRRDDTDRRKKSRWGKQGGADGEGGNRADNVDAPGETIAVEEHEVAEGEVCYSQKGLGALMSMMGGK